MCDIEKRKENDELLEKGFKEPYFPYDACPRRWDGNEILGNLSNWVRHRVRPVLRIRPIEFVYTLMAGPVIYDEPEDIPFNREAVEEHITTGTAERLKEIYEHSRELMEREENTRASVEGRANVLLGAGGLTTTLIIGVSGLLARDNIDSILPSGTAVRAAFIGLYLFGFFALIMSLLRAVQAAGVVSHQPFSATLPFELQNYAPVPRFRRLIREAFLTYVELRLINRIKAGFLRAAQWWFGVALALLLTMAAVPVIAPFAGSLAEALAQVLTQLGGLVSSVGSGGGL